MPQNAALDIAGHASVTTRVNVRQGSATRKAPVLRKLNPGESVEVLAIVVGDSVQGNAHWYRLAGDAYIWSGACGPLHRNSSAVLPSAPANGASSIAEAGLEGYGLTAEFATRLAELILACREQGYMFRISQGLRPPRTQALYYCQWGKRTPAMIDARVTALRDAGAPWTADLLASLRDVPRIPRWQTNALPGAGWHQWGEAADCYCWRGGVLVGNGSDPAYKAYADLATSMGLTAGLYFSDPDAGHVQLRKAGGATDIYSWPQIDSMMQERFGDKPAIV